MLTRWILAALMAAGLICNAAVAVTPFAKATVFVTLDVKGSSLSGTLWMDRDAVEVKFPIDKNGDVNYTDSELMLVRGPLTDYINANLQIMWDGQVHPISASGFDYAAHPVERNNGVKILFNVSGYKAGTPIVIYSRLLADLWRQAQTVVAITNEGQKEVWALGTGHYYDSRLSPLHGKSASSQPSATTGAIKPRYGCAAMCLGVDFDAPIEKCPRCAGPAASLFGAAISGKGYIGPMGGVVMNFVPGAYKLEAVLVSRGELRFYLCTEGLVVQPAAALTGKVQLWPAGSQSVTPAVELKRASDGAYLAIAVPDTISAPFQARCTLNSAEFPGNRMVEFYIPIVAGLK
ncbi:hypothetical protein B7486_16950 [cyanobacterium TDX16]|nr:hypothetical protein B7486_16950 [cyanobacterium TDX16]